MKDNAKTIATGSDIRDVDRLVKKYGGTKKGWKKRKELNEKGDEWHWYEYNGKVYELRPHSPTMW
jgi:hypothetical protein